MYDYSPIRFMSAQKMLLDTIFGQGIYLVFFTDSKKSLIGLIKGWIFSIEILEFLYIVHGRVHNVHERVHGQNTLWTFFHPLYLLS